MLRVPALILVCLPLLTIPDWAEALNCPDPLPLSCGDELTVNSCSGPTAFDVYACLGWEASGSENVYLLTLDNPTDLVVDLQPLGFWFSWDAVVAVLPVLDGDCHPNSAFACVDEAGVGGGEQLIGALSAGSYYLVVDGYAYGDCGDYQLTVSCSDCPDCLDADGDGAYAYDPAQCPCGSDCNDGDPDRHPDAREICGDDIDQNCDGHDDPCPACSSDLTILCGDTNSADTHDGRSNLNYYCGSETDWWYQRELVFAITPDSEGTIGVTISNMGTKKLDAFALHNFGVEGVCNKNACVDHSMEDSGTQELAFYSEADQTYYISVDGRNGQEGSFDYAVACLTEACTPTGQLSCGDDITGDTTGGNSNVTAYRGISWRFTGPEVVTTLTADYDAMVTLTLKVDAVDTAPADLALIVLDDDGSSACLPGNTLTYSDYIQDTNDNPPEVVSFLVAAGATYFVVVEGFRDQDQGSYSLKADCAVECPTGKTDCGGTCHDLQTDASHCGSCQNTCAFDQASSLCAEGTCTLGACDPGWDDCNASTGDGCEASLSSPQHCGTCLTACAYSHATALCEEGTCLMGACQEGFGDCDATHENGCESELDTASNCGSCGNACTEEAFCFGGQCVTECPQGLSECDNVCLDTSTDVNHCGACNTVCTAPHGTPGCAEGVCILTGCEPGWANCDTAALNGCEIQLGMIDHCSACDDACSYLNATATCEAGQCTPGACVTGWDDCDAQPGNGCEADLGSKATCGSCSVSCGFDQRCIGGTCMQHCDDADGDEHEDVLCGGDDCNDSDDSIHPGAEDVCGDTIDQDCDGEDAECTCPDRDADGHRDEACGGDDCDDLNGYIQPGIQEDCTDGVDQDCDKLTDCDDPDCAEHSRCSCPDEDDDGHQVISCGGDDCDDSASSIHPGALDDCGDGVDQDCDGADRKCPGSDPGCGCGAQDGNFDSRILVVLAGLLLARRKRLLTLREGRC